MIADKNVPRIINSRIGKLDKEMLEEAQLLAFDYNLPGFNLYTYGDSGAYDLTVPALWIVSNCFSNVVHVDSADKTKTTYTAWWQARHHDETGQWTLADNETDQNKVQNGAFLIPSLGLGINLQKMCGQGFVEATFQAKSHYHVTTASEQAPGYTRHGLGVAVTSRQVNTAVLAHHRRPYISLPQSPLAHPLHQIAINLRGQIHGRQG
ncbi:hypothetical protein BS47DRAFT_534314 [Hydnum rufescens UP504]|uniref:Glutamine amidotransferase type-2 domain-containing protein n=1 Tax=Hydnum rufescens UP504 TaxID=1448309 RepID=A0A9P6AHN4_9AGAM|nr:hypothetical protein BS47DRAFT_534314 [Hydnum rufescens UP504]